MDTGKVYLLGAGPGDAGLFTRKGYEVLQKADVVLYDSLVSAGILANIPDGVRCIHVGKRAGKHTVPQEEINRHLLEEARSGNTVVRLKGGDPFLFGRGGEELELLADAGIPFEVIPGITSPIAVPAYNGIPVTHRDFTSSLHIITGHKRQGKELDIDFEALVRTKGTLVFLMGVSTLHDICEGLLRAGMPADMPAAILQQGTTAGQKRIVATVSTLEERVREEGIIPPAVIVVGKVCALADRFAWYEKLPLAGCRVLVTRPKGRSGTLAKMLREKGAEVLEIPAIETIPADDMSELDNAINNIKKYKWLAFTSPYGVQVFFDRMKVLRADIRSLGGLKIAALGEGTAKELLGKGINADLIPEVYDGQSLGRAIAQQAEPGDRILLPRARIGNEEIITELADFPVDDIAIYETKYVPSRIVNETGMFTKKEIDCAVFTSSSSVRAFARANAYLDFSGVDAICIGRQTAQTAEEFGMQVTVARKAAIEELVEAVEEYYHQKK